MGNEQFLVLTTQFHREDYMFNNPKRKKKKRKNRKMVSAFPQRPNIWNYTYLQIFISQMHTFIPNSHPFCIIDDDNSQRKLYFHFHDSNNPDNKIKILILKSIYVYLSLNFLKDSFEIEKKVFYSSIGAKKVENSRTSKSC